MERLLWKKRKINLSITNSVFGCNASLGQDANDFTPKIEVLKSPKIHQSHSWSEYFFQIIVRKQNTESWGMHHPRDVKSRSPSFNSCPLAAFNGQRGPLCSGLVKTKHRLLGFCSPVLVAPAWAVHQHRLPLGWGQACPELPQKAPRFWSSLGL